MKKITIICMVLLLFNINVFAEDESNTETENTVTYSDFDTASYWFGRFNMDDVMPGYEDGTFRPDNYITRAEFTEVLAKLRSFSTLLTEGTPDEEIYFTDIDSNHPAYNSIRAAVNAGFVSGYDDGSFRPDEYVTYEQGAKMTLSMLGYDALADMYGGYPTGYMALAYNNRFFKPKDSPLDWPYCTVENMTEQMQKLFMTRRDAANFASRAFTTKICVVTGEETNWDGSHSPTVKIGGEHWVKATIYSTSGHVIINEE